jgi:hypothetical protein
MVIKSLLSRLKLLWVAASMIAAVWFLYWIYYDVTVWSKALTQVAPANYAGLIVSIVLAVGGTQLERIGVFNKLLLPSEQHVYKQLRQNSQPTKRTRIRPVDQTLQSQPAKKEDTVQIPQGASVPRGCKFFIGYLHTRPASVEIPEECLECEHVVECMSPSSATDSHKY